MDTAVTKKDDFNNPTNVTKILKLFPSRKSIDRPLVDQFSKKGHSGSNAGLEQGLCFMSISKFPVKFYL